MSIFGDMFRLARVGATLRRTGALWPVLDALGVSTFYQKLIWGVLTPSWPFGLSGEPDLPPVSRALNALGPSYVKFGQVLSTRPDIAGEALSGDLRTLQDKLPPFPEKEARATIEIELGQPIDALFRRLDPPVAAASIAQVHPAVTLDGRKVAVKVLRPRIERAFARDISAFYFAARLLQRLQGSWRRLRPTAVVRHFEGVVTREMDLRLEAAACSEYGDNTKDEAGFRTPDVLWSHSAKRVLTSSWASGDGMGDIAALKARGVDLEELALRLVRLYLRTALRDGYFHADMHHGNLKLAEDGAIVAYDFGIMGRIDAKTRRTYAEILYSYLTRDYRRGAQAHFDAGYVSREHSLEEFAQALRSIGEPIVGQQASRISMARVLAQLFDVTEQFGMETRPELILLQRTMVVIEGVARSLDPDFNMWEAARPEVERWMTDNLGPKATLRDFTEAAQALSRLGPRLPALAERLVEMAEGWEHPAERSAPAKPPRGRSSGRFWRGVLLGLAIGLAAAAAVHWAQAEGLAPPFTSAFTV